MSPLSSVRNHEYLLRLWWYDDGGLLTISTIMLILFTSSQPYPKLARSNTKNTALYSTQLHTQDAHFQILSLVPISNCHYMDFSNQSRIRNCPEVGYCAQAFSKQNVDLFYSLTSKSTFKCCNFNPSQHFGKKNQNCFFFRSWSWPPNQILPNSLMSLGHYHLG